MRKDCIKKLIHLHRWCYPLAFGLFHFQIEMGNFKLYYTKCALADWPLNPQFSPLFPLNVCQAPNQELSSCLRPFTSQSNFSCSFLCNYLLTMKCGCNARYKEAWEIGWEGGDNWWWWLIIDWGWWGGCWVLYSLPLNCTASLSSLLGWHCEARHATVLACHNRASSSL